METLVNSNAMKVNLPDMNAYVYIREQNGEDDDILSNPIKSETLSNFSEFISRIVVDTNLLQIESSQNNRHMNYPVTLDMQY